MVLICSTVLGSRDQIVTSTPACPSTMANAVPQEPEPITAALVMIARPQRRFAGQVETAQRVALHLGYRPTTR
jgi:hypothetical protein